MSKRYSLIVMLLLALLVLPRAALAREYDEKEEARLGKEAAAEIEREFKVVDLPEELRRIDAILKTLAPVTERPEVVYQAKILDTQDVNALSLPGGYIYVTRGLLEAVGSDDELAGVLAHEIAHNTHRHALKQLEKSAKIDQRLMLALMVSILAGGDPGNLMFLGQVLRLNALNGYGRESELEADRSAVRYLIDSKRYNPLGMLKFMENLARDEGRRPQVDWGIFRTHPDTRLRVDKIRDQLEANGFDTGVRLRDKHTPVGTARAATVNGKEIGEVTIRERVLFQPAAEDAGKQPLARAEEFANRVSAVFQEYPERRHVGARAEGEAWVVLYRDVPLLVVTPADASFHGSTPAELATLAVRALRAVIWEDFVRRAY